MKRIDVNTQEYEVNSLYGERPHTATFSCENGCTTCYKRCPVGQQTFEIVYK